MKIVKVEADGFECSRCSHVWVPKKAGFQAKTCPKCRSPYWMKERKAKKGKEEYRPGADGQDEVGKTGAY